MRQFASFLTSITLGMAAVTAVPAMAQASDQAAPKVNLAAGTVVYDSEGTQIGTIGSVDGDNVSVQMIDNRSVALPANAFAKTDKGPAITITLAQLTAAVDKMAADSKAALEAALQPGVEVRSAGGTAIVGTIKLADADGAVVTTPAGDVRLPRAAFFMSQAGLATSFTAEQFTAAVAQAKEAAIAQANAANAANGAEPATSAQADTNEDSETTN
jgi:hypothetical protein